MGAEVIISPRGSVFASSTLREQHSCNRSKLPTGHIAAQTPQGQPCSTGVGNNPLTITKPSQCTVSRMPKARRSRLSLTRRAGWATLPLLCIKAPSYPTPKAAPERTGPCVYGRVGSLFYGFCIRLFRILILPLSLICLSAFRIYFAPIICRKACFCLNPMQIIAFCFT